MSWKNLVVGVIFIHLLFVLAAPGFTEDLEPRRWSHLPIDTNFAGFGYAFTSADIVLDPVLRAEDVQMDMHTWLASYIRTFALMNRSARIDVKQPYQMGKWTGLVDGVPRTVKRNGLTDTFVRISINLLGAPPLKGKDYATYRSQTKIENIIGVGLSLQLPTGEYMSDKLINLGTNRYTYRPQLGYVHSRGKWSGEISGTVEIYSDNDSFFNGSKLEQDPLYFVHSHLVYTFKPRLWTSVSFGYDTGGRSTVNGEKKNDRKENFYWAVSLGFPVFRQISAKVGYIGSHTNKSVGFDSDTFTVGLSTNW